MAEKRMDLKALRELSEADAVEQRQKLRQELWQHRIKARDGSLQQTHHFSTIRRQIARINTVLRQRSATAAQAPAAR